MYKIWAIDSDLTTEAIKKLNSTGEYVEIIPVTWYNFYKYVAETGGGPLPNIYKDGEHIGGYDDLVIYQYLSTKPLEAPTEPSDTQATIVPETLVEPPIEAPNATESTS